MRGDLERHGAVGLNALIYLALLLLSCVIASTAYAAKGGNGGGGGGGGGGPTNGDLYGDAIYLWRDVNGVLNVLNDCIRPLGANGKILELNVDRDTGSGEFIKPEAIDDSFYDAVCDDDDLALLSALVTCLPESRAPPAMGWLV